MTVSKMCMDMSCLVIYVVLLSSLMKSVLAEEKETICSENEHSAIGAQSGILISSQNLGKCLWRIHPTGWERFTVKLKIQYVDKDGQQTYFSQRGNLTLRTAVELKTKTSVCYDNCLGEIVLMEGCKSAEIFKFDIVAAIEYEMGQENNVRIEFETEQCKPVPQSTLDTTTEIHGSTTKFESSTDSLFSLLTTRRRTDQKETSSTKRLDYVTTTINTQSALLGISTATLSKKRETTATQSQINESRVIQPYIIGVIVASIALLVMLILLFLLWITRRKLTPSEDDVDLAVTPKTMNNILYEDCGDNFEKETKDNVLYETYPE